MTSAADNIPLPGISVTVKGTKRGTQTNEKGGFTIAAARGEVLEFSGAGFNLNSITVRDNPTINVPLTRINN